MFNLFTFVLMSLLKWLYYIWDLGLYDNSGVGLAP